MIVEIGTSDFRTYAGKVEGIFIEPIKHYFDRLPECKKENVAISNFTGTTTGYYIDDATIKKHGLNDWIRGCNSINEPHPTVIKLGWKKYQTTQQIDVVRIKSIIDKYELKYIDFLKIDTEGHDCIILNDYLDTVQIKPKKIQFENNVLANKAEVKKVVARLRGIGYVCTQVKDDIVCKL